MPQFLSLFATSVWIAMAGVGLAPAAAESPRAVVARWLELHRTGDRDGASALTTGSRDHFANVLLPANRDTGVRVAQSLGNPRAAAVVSTALKRGKKDAAEEGERVLLFWLVARDGVWRIHKSSAESRRVVDERLRGFLEAGDVRWEVQRDQLLGRWESGPCRLPMIRWTACGSQLQLGDDEQFGVAAWGPGGPPPNKQESMMRGAWKLDDGRLLISHEGQTHEWRITWLSDDRLVVQSPDGKSRAEYERWNPDWEDDLGQ